MSDPSIQRPALILAGISRAAAPDVAADEATRLVPGAPRFDAVLDAELATRGATRSEHARGKRAKEVDDDAEVASARESVADPPGLPTDAQERLADGWGDAGASEAAAARAGAEAAAARAADRGPGSTSTYGAPVSARVLAAVADGQTPGGASGRSGFASGAGGTSVDERREIAGVTDGGSAGGSSVVAGGTSAGGTAGGTGGTFPGRSDASAGGAGIASRGGDGVASSGGAGIASRGGAGVGAGSASSGDGGSVRGGGDGGVERDGGGRRSQGANDEVECADRASSAVADGSAAATDVAEEVGGVGASLRAVDDPPLDAAEGAAPSPSAIANELAAPAATALATSPAALPASGDHLPALDATTAQARGTTKATRTGAGGGGAGPSSLVWLASSGATAPDGDRERAEGAGAAKASAARASARAGDGDRGNARGLPPRAGARAETTPITIASLAARLGDADLGTRMNDALRASSAARRAPADGAPTALRASADGAPTELGASADGAPTDATLTSIDASMTSTDGGLTGGASALTVDGSLALPSGGVAASDNALTVGHRSSVAHAGEPRAAQVGAGEATRGHSVVVQAADQRALRRGLHAEIDLGEAGRVVVHAENPGARIHVRLDADAGHTARALAQNAGALAAELRTEARAASVTVSGPGGSSTSSSGAGGSGAGTGPGTGRDAREPRDDNAVTGTSTGRQKGRARFVL